jgi:hypothetical protein
MVVKFNIKKRLFFMNTHDKEKEIVDIIKEKYPQFPVELLELIHEYINIRFVNQYNKLIKKIK